MQQQQQKDKQPIAEEKEKDKADQQHDGSEAYSDPQDAK